MLVKRISWAFHADRHTHRNNQVQCVDYGENAKNEVTGQLKHIKNKIAMDVKVDLLVN